MAFPKYMIEKMLAALRIAVSLRGRAVLPPETVEEKMVASIVIDLAKALASAVGLTGYTSPSIDDFVAEILALKEGNEIQSVFRRHEALEQVCQVFAGWPPVQPNVSEPRCEQSRCT
jgi:uncharacterized protein YfeS